MRIISVFKEVVTIIDQEPSRLLKEIKKINQQFDNVLNNFADPQEQLEAELSDIRLLQAISATLIQQDNVNGLYEEILAAAIAIMRSDFASIQMLYPQRGGVGELHLLAFRGFNQQAAKFWEWVRADSQSTCGLALRTRRRVIAADVDKCDFMNGADDQATYLQTGIRAVQTTPLLSRGGEVVGMISTHWRKPHQPSERDLRLFDILTRQAADFIEQKKVEEELRESQERYSALISASSQVLYRMNPDWSELQQLQGGSFVADSENPTRSWLQDYIHPDDQEWVLEAIDKAIQTKTIYELEHRVRRIDGTLGWTISRAVPVLNAAGTVIEWFGAAADITERKYREANLAFLVELAKDLDRHSSVGEIMQVVGVRVGEYLNISNSFFAVLDKAKNQVNVQYAWRAEDLPQIVGVHSFATFMAQDLHQSMPTGEPIVIRNSQTDLRVNSEGFAALNINAVVIVPFFGDSEWKHLFIVSDTTARDWRSDEIELIREVTNRTFPRLERACVEKTLHESEERYRTLANRLQEIDLPESEERFFKIFHNSPDMITIIKVEDNKYFEVNQKFLDVVEYTREEVLGHTEKELNIWVKEPNLSDFFVDELREGMKNVESNIRSKSGTIFTVLSSVELINLNGQLCRISIMKDITKEKRLEGEIARLDRLNLIGEMAASIGHEVRNPMTTVRGFLQLMAAKEFDSKKLEYYNIMIEELDRANSIITEFLSLAKDRRVLLKPDSLNSIIKSLYPLLLTDAIRQDKQIIIKEGCIKNILLNDKEMRQLIINLVKNGLEATSPGGSVTISTYEDNDEVILLVEDQGSGIKPEIYQKLGTPFITTKEKGTGLGLSVCYSIANKHNARIDVKTGPSGTTFSVKFKKLC